MFFILDTTRKGARFIHANWLWPGAQRRLPSISLQTRLLTGGICMTRRWWMHPALTLSYLDCAISGKARWASSWISLLSPRPCWLHRLPVRLHKVNTLLLVNAHILTVPVRVVSPRYYFKTRKTYESNYHGYITEQPAICGHLPQNALTTCKYMCGIKHTICTQ